MQVMDRCVLQIRAGGWATANRSTYPKLETWQYSREGGAAEIYDGGKKAAHKPMDPIVRFHFGPGNVGGSLEKYLSMLDTDAIVARSCWQCEPRRCQDN